MGEGVTGESRQNINKNGVTGERVKGEPTKSDGLIVKGDG